MIAQSAPIGTPMFLDVAKGIMTPVWVRWFSQQNDTITSAILDVSPSAQSSMASTPQTAAVSSAVTDTGADDTAMFLQPLTEVSSRDNSVDPMAPPASMSTYNDTDYQTLFWMGAT